MIIAIDGPSGTGKSTVAQAVAKALKFLYLDTGAIYRAFAYFLVKNQASFEDNDTVENALKLFDLDIEHEQDQYKYLLDGEDISDVIRQEKISELASKIGKNPLVRQELLMTQRSFAKKGNLVAEGRDIGTVVFPQSEVKIFLTAQDEIRAQRRLDQLNRKFPSSTHSYETILEDIRNRDENDKGREVAPLKQAKDAILIDTSHITVDGVIDQILNIVSKVVV
jgi:cytidylate kinase